MRERKVMWGVTRILVRLVRIAVTGDAMGEDG